MKIHLLAIGKAKGAIAELIADYSKRLAGSLQIRELSGATAKAEGEALTRALPDGATVVLLDEHGKDLSSRELATQLQKWEDTGVRDLAFVIGGADGLTDSIRAKANFTLGLGRKTWPHMLARLMLVEQIYRAKQINAGHPYHRD